MVNNSGESILPINCVMLLNSDEAVYVNRFHHYIIGEYNPFGMVMLRVVDADGVTSEFRYDEVKKFLYLVPMDEFKKIAIGHLKEDGFATDGFVDDIEEGDEGESFDPSIFSVDGTSHMFG